MKKCNLCLFVDMTSLVTTTVQVENNNKVTSHNDRLANGINVGTNYRLLSIDKVTYKFGYTSFGSGDNSMQTVA